MSIYEFAMQMEQDGEAFYRELAAKTNDTGIRRILIMLADDETKHYNTLKQMKEAVEPQMTTTAILTNAKNIFAQMKGQEFDLDISHVDLCKKAQDIEHKSQIFYQEKAKEVSSPTQKELFLKMADEEKRHYFLLDNVIAFLSRPYTWIENAEFNHLDEY